MIRGSTAARERVYVDHAATSFPKPPEVWEAFLEQARDLGAPAGRSGYATAAETDTRIHEARAAVARFLGSRPERTVFTLNATDALNIALKGLLRAGDHVVTTSMEHNSVLRPLERLRAARGVEVTRVAADRQGLVSADAIRASIRPRTRLVAMVHASNVTGTIQPLAAVAEIARANRVPLLVDAAQTAGTLPLSLERDGIDLLAAPGHKGLLGPPGTGVLAFSDRVELESLREGGTGSVSEELAQPEIYPDRLEAGSPNTPGIVALGAAVAFIDREGGVERIRERLEELMAALDDGLERIDGVERFGADAVESREPVTSIRVRGYSPTELTATLDSAFGIEARAGLHCAPEAHRTIGTFPEGTCRLSLGAMSRGSDVARVVEALRELAAG